MTPSSQTAFEQAVIHSIEKLQAATKHRWEQAGIVGFSLGGVRANPRLTSPGEIGN